MSLHLPLCMLQLQEGMVEQVCGVERRQSTFEGHKQEVEHFLKDNISQKKKKKEEFHKFHNH